MVHDTRVPTPLIFFKGSMGPRVVSAPMDMNRVTPALTRAVEVQTPGTYSSVPLAVQWGRAFFGLMGWWWVWCAGKVW